jgi:hypothetical protein
VTVSVAAPADPPPTAPQDAPDGRLSPLVRHWFATLPRAGVLPPQVRAGAARVLRGEAGSESGGTRVVFHIAATADGRVTDVRFQAYGCPHTLATAAWLAEQLPGRTLDNLLPSPPADWLVQLQSPVEKLGRLLLVEDALRAIA